MIELKCAAILGVLGNPKDRFMTIGYREDSPTVSKRLQRVAELGLVHGIEITEGDGRELNAGNKEEVRSLLSQHGLALCAVNPNLWGERQWLRGTLSASDRSVRQAALDRIRRAMDLADELGCNYVGIWPGQDGYDYCFEIDYQRAYDWWVEGTQKCADHNPRIRLGLEYKPFEPRTHSLLDTCAKTLLLLDDIGRDNVGLTLDVGHALVAHEDLGEVVALSQRRKKLFHLHLNDNYADWDWDMNFGSVRLLEFVELVYWLRRTGYAGWYSIDVFPYRTEGDASVEESIRWLQAVVALTDRIGLEKLDQTVSLGDPIAASRLLRQALFEAGS